ncbi:MAG TPA: sortase [Acidimicrobiales bacterium]|nr:sortase [Acidimicrobiales bacterium]
MSQFRRAVIGAVVAIFVASGCGAATESARPQAEARAQSQIPPTALDPGLVDAAPATTVEAPKIVLAGPAAVVPQPIDIPENSYASEPVIQIGTIEIPKLRLVHPVYDGVTLHNIDLGPSHWPGTAEPGQIGNTVFAGHRVTQTSPFRDIDDLDAGDKVIFDVHGTRTTYHVTASMVVDDSEMWIADQTPTPTGTLYACHPLGSTAQRYVVRLALDSPAA